MKIALLLGRDPRKIPDDVRHIAKAIGEPNSPAGKVAIFTLATLAAIVYAPCSGRSLPLN